MQTPSLCNIIGPFYRPDSPVRNDFRIKRDRGVPVVLSGAIRHSDCQAPYKKAKIELWHCNNDGVYDNTSNEYRYRGTSFSDEEGRYSFSTILPIPYNGGGEMRPAHFHLMITAEGYQPLITQLYFTGDPYLDEDLFSRSPAAKRRILEVQTAADGTKQVLYDISMAEKLDVEPAALDKIVGQYICVDDSTMTCEFFARGKRLWYDAVFGKKLDPYGRILDYMGKNTFQCPRMPAPLFDSYTFELLDTDGVKCTEVYVNPGGKKSVSVFLRNK